VVKKHPNWPDFGVVKIGVSVWEVSKGGNCEERGDFNRRSEER